MVAAAAAATVSASLLQHGAVTAVVECVAGNSTVWRQQLEARAAQQQDAQGHKPQTWEDLQKLLHRCVVGQLGWCAMRWCIRCSAEPPQQYQCAYQCVVTQCCCSACLALRRCAHALKAPCNCSHESVAGLALTNTASCCFVNSSAGPVVLSDLLYNHLAVLCRYGDSHQWTTDGSCTVEHLLVVDTTAMSLEQQTQQVVDFLQSVLNGPQ